MTVRVVLPGLRSHVDGAREVAVAGDNVRSALYELIRTHPSLADVELLNADGDLNWFVQVFKNDVSVRDLDFGLEEPLSDDDRLVVLFAMAGG